MTKRAARHDRRWEPEYAGAHGRPPAVPSAARVKSVDVAAPRPDPGGADRVSGIDKRPAPHIDVFAPGPDYGDGSGVVGDVIGDSKHHGGAHKAVYAFAREELDFWWGER